MTPFPSLSLSLYLRDPAPLLKIRVRFTAWAKVQNYSIGLRDWLGRQVVLDGYLRRMPYQDETARTQLGLVTALSSISPLYRLVWTIHSRQSI